jgi:hypothetical protein
MRSKIPDLVAKSRLDLSDWLWHFTRRDRNPVKSLEAILSSGHIKGGCDAFCPELCVCLTEMPLAEAVRQAEALRAANYNRLSEYGVGFRKAWVFDQGGLPVIYQPNSLKDKLPPDMRWRHCELDYKKGIDFTWQREWRVHVDRLVFNRDDDVVIVLKDLGEIFEVMGGLMYTDDIHDEVFIECDWYFITHEVLMNADRPHDIDAIKTRDL